MTLRTSDDSRDEDVHHKEQVGSTAVIETEELNEGDGDSDTNDNDDVESEDDEDDSDDDQEEEEEAEEEEDDEEEEEEEPPYSVDEIVGTIRDFYKFLATLHFSSTDLLIPPSSGWEHVQEIEATSAHKSALVLSVLKHLPFYRSTTPAQIHYKSRIRDYSNIVGTELASDDYNEYFNDILPDLWDEDVGNDNRTTSKDILILAEGHESGGRTLVLVPKRGEIIEEILRCDTVGPIDLVEYFDTLKQKYSTLQIIGGVGKIPIEADVALDTSQPSNECSNKDNGDDHGNIPESGPESDDLHFITNFNVERLRWIYYRHGWPNAFKCKEAMTEIDQWMQERAAQGKDTWEKDEWIGQQMIGT